VPDRKVILASKRTPNRKIPILTAAVAGWVIAVAATGSAAAASATTVTDATGQATTTTTARYATVHHHVRFPKPHRRVHHHHARFPETHRRVHHHHARFPETHRRVHHRHARFPETHRRVHHHHARFPDTYRRFNYRPAAYQGAAAGGSFGACVRSRESGGNYQAWNAAGYYGAYQFSASTWTAYGGSAASFGHASPAEQDRIFGNALARGGQSNWAPYDGC
jgi:Transglycosylase-like domain